MKIYNTLTRRKEPFVPLTPGEVKMYVCGQTVYNYIHIGNARFYVAFDAIRRYLEYRGYRVRYVQNFTDVDDKIIQRSQEEGISVQAVSRKYIEETLKDLTALHVKPATEAPRATEDMPEIIAMIDTLIEKGYAYVNEGTVFFHTAKAEAYGKLSQKNLADLAAGARVEVNAAKRDPMDFVLWKPDKPGEPKWESPWGTGRPGWHIECSAMVKKYLGDTIDIHGGGEDLIFPHHENEIAQSEAANGAPFARYWMHNGMMTAGHRKMSKSTGNFYPLREVAERYSYEVIRFYLLCGHYRMPMEYGEPLLAAAQSGLGRIKNAWDTLGYLLAQKAEMEPGKQEKPTEEDRRRLAEAETYRHAFEAAMDDDFNTADAVTAIFALVKHINTQVSVHNPSETSQAYASGLKQLLEALCGILGLTFQAETTEDAEVEALIAERQAARARKDWPAADRIRDTLAARGITLSDTAGGVSWKR